MSSYVLRRFSISLVIASAMVALITTYSFAQELENTLQQTRTTETRQVREKASDRVAEKRALMQQTNAAAKAKFSEDLAAIRDEGKRTIVERINTQLQTMNESKTTKWANALDALSEILDRINAGVNTFKQNGVDTTSADTLVVNAQGAIESASTAVAAQAEKSYIIEITDESTLRQSIQPTIQEFKEDLMTTLATVKSARDTAILAARGLAALSSDPVETPPQTLDLQPDSGSELIQ